MTNYLWTVYEACEALGVSRFELCKLIRVGRVEAFPTDNGERYRLGERQTVETITKSFDDSPLTREEEAGFQEIWIEMWA